MDAYRQNIADNLPPLVIDFFVTFSRFEFALKRGGFLKGNVGDTAEPHWDNFAAALGPAFFARMQVEKAVQVLFNNHPKRLRIVAPDEVQFQAPNGITENGELFVAIRRVRNNLFHGEKPYIDARDHELIQAALFVLDCAMETAGNLDACKRVPSAFAFAPLKIP